MDCSTPRSGTNRDPRLRPRARTVGQGLSLLIACAAGWPGAPAASDEELASPCANGIAVPHPEDHPRLVADCEVLLDLRDQLAGDAFLNWSVERPITRWRGVWVDHTYVRRLVLAGMGLSGTLPPQLGQLAELETLYIFENKLTGPIPPEIEQLTELKWLALSHNGLTGPIPPQLGGLTNLNGLYLHGNGLTGAIPPELARLPNLRVLNLRSNDLTGSIPPQLAELPHLTALYLHDNGLTGPIPPHLGQMAELELLNLKATS